MEKAFELILRWFLKKTTQLMINNRCPKLINISIELITGVLGCICSTKLTKKRCLLFLLYSRGSRLSKIFIPLNKN